MSIVLAAACLVWVALISVVIGFVFGGWAFAGWFTAGLLLAVVIGSFLVICDAYRNAIEIPAIEIPELSDPQVGSLGSAIPRFQPSRSRDQWRLGGMRNAGFRSGAMENPRKMRSRRPGSR